MVTSTTENNKTNSEPSTVFENDDFVYTKNTDSNGKVTITGGGYRINSYFLENDQPIFQTITTSNPKHIKELKEGNEEQEEVDNKDFISYFLKSNTDNQFSNNVNDNNNKEMILDQFIVPAGLFYSNYQNSKPLIDAHASSPYNHEVLSEDIYAKLYELAKAPSPSIEKMKSKHTKHKRKKVATKKTRKHRVRY